MALEANDESRLVAGDGARRRFLGRPGRQIVLSGMWNNIYIILWQLA